MEMAIIIQFAVIVSQNYNNIGLNSIAALIEIVGAAAKVTSCGLSIDVADNTISSLIKVLPDLRQFAAYQTSPGDRALYQQHRRFQ